MVLNSHEEHAPQVARRRNRPQVSAARLHLKHKGGDTSERTSKTSQFRHAVKNSIDSVGHDYSVYLGFTSNVGANEYTSIK